MLNPIIPILKFIHNKLPSIASKYHIFPLHSNGFSAIPQPPAKKKEKKYQYFATNLQQPRTQ